VPPEKTAKKNSNPKFNELKSRITALQGQIEPELYQRLERMAKRLENDAKPEYLEKLEDHIKDIESDIKEAQKKKQKENEADNLEYDGGLDAFECTRVEHTQTLINNFRMLARR
jgi:soluble cytochrome b562